MFSVEGANPIQIFDVPSNICRVRIVVSFDADLIDKQYILAVRDLNLDDSISQEIEGLNWSSTLGSSFEYVAALQRGDTYYGRYFYINSDGAELQVSCIRWGKSDSSEQAEVLSMALEVYSDEWEIPMPFERILIPGRTA